MKIDLKKIRKAAITLSNLSENSRNLFLRNLAIVINERKRQIMEANKIDVANAAKKKLSQPFVQRLIFDSAGIDNMQKRLQSLKKLKRLMLLLTRI